RTQLIALMFALPIAVLVDAVAVDRTAWRSIWRKHLVLVAGYSIGLVSAALVVALGGSPLGNYAETARGGVIQWRLAEAFAQHAAILALTLAFLPFLLGTAWLQSALRGAPAERRFAAVALPAIVLVLLEAASF